MAPKSLRRILTLISMRLFAKSSRHRTQVAYGQTLSKKRKSCVLKSVSSLSSSCESSQLYPAYSLNSINFEFSRKSTRYRGSVMDFQKIDPGDLCCLHKCCDKCFCSDSASRTSLSSDSACDVTSASSCEDLTCEFRETKLTTVGTVEDFIKIHSANFEPGLSNPACEDCDPDYETLNSKVKEEKEVESKRASLVESDYDILVTRDSYHILEPKYENLKRLENLYEAPHDGSTFRCSENCPFKKIRDLVHSNRTYDEVIESLKVLHMKTQCWMGQDADADAVHRRPRSVCGFYESLETTDNDINQYLEEEQLRTEVTISSFKSRKNQLSEDTTHKI